jgi:serine/threonine protein kinase
VAIKKFYKPVESEEIQRLRKTLQDVTNLRHPHLLSTRAYWVAPDRQLHVVRDLADKTLRDRLRECQGRGSRGIRPVELLMLMKQSALALDYLHGKGLFHGDINPDNILLLNGIAKIGDINLARKQADSGNRDAGGNTRAYIAPECSAEKFSKFSDQYSLALTYSELRTSNLAQLEPAEEPIVRRALAEQPEGRFPTCLAFVEALESTIALSESERASAEEKGIPPSRRYFSMGKALYYLWMTIFALVAVAFGVVVLSRMFRGR